MNALLLGILAALISAFAWAFSTVLIRVGLQGKSPISANIFRLYVVSLMYIAIFAISGTFGAISSLPWRLIAVAFVSAQFGFVIGDYFYFNALKRMGVSRTVPVTSTYPLWAILWAFLFLGREIEPQIIVGAFLVVLAVVIVRKAEERENLDPKGFIFALLAPVSWSVAVVTMDWLTQSIDVLALAGLRMMLAALGVSVFLPRYADELRSMSLREALILTGAALFGLLIGQYTFVYSVRTIGSQIAAPVSAINPIIASVLAIVFLKESPNRRILEGLILAVLGVILISTA